MACLLTVKTGKVLTRTVLVGCRVKLSWQLRAGSGGRLKLGWVLATGTLLVGSQASLSPIKELLG